MSGLLHTTRQGDSTYYDQIHRDQDKVAGRKDRSIPEIAFST